MTSPGLARAPNDEFDLVYRRELGFVWRVLRYHGVAAEAIEDAVQDVFMVVHRRWDAWDHQQSIRSWLFGIARRVAATRRRGTTRHERKLAAIPEPAPTAALDEQAADRETLRRLAEVLSQLDTKLAAVFVLAEIEGMTAPEIAKELDTKLNTVYWRLRTARAHVNGAMAQQECPS
ncbi:RNA polymerase sigma-70 factor [Enhygromyxa salina]|uniref:RNA polymerase sigma-70 factor n=1 Tax=Enhygromyxa salina TaxID=215803 RepID=A0A0C2A6T9_9BACT|nr:sigma-70 family RNA polymerase sigma factor [Enhygromyxa salina]KIG19118.1 RNA polymerase sigma-70 factor [Enhygromyxa salina]